MIEFLSGPGFLGTHAPLVSDLSLVLVSLSAIMLTIGWQLARHGHYEAHRWVQTSAVALNTAVILLVMVSSFVIHILPGIPAKLLTGDYAITTLHALTGTLGAVLGVFVVLRGNGLVPKAWQFENYRPVMWTAYVLYMLATALGIAVYVLAFVLGI